MCKSTHSANVKVMQRDTDDDYWEVKQHTGADKSADLGTSSVCVCVFVCRRERERQREVILFGSRKLARKFLLAAQPCRQTVGHCSLADERL